jgi:hypothetical protein
MMPTTQFDESDLAFEKANIGKLEKVVNDAVTAISAKTSLPVNEVLEVLENVRVEMVGEIRGAVDSLGNLSAVKHADAAKLSKAIEDAIGTIANATDLDTDEITWIFTRKPGAGVEDIVFRLNEKSKFDRSLLSDRIGPEADHPRVLM